MPSIRLVSNKFVYTQWFEHFVNTTKPIQDLLILLVLDGRTSHKRNTDIINMARANHVKIICFSPGLGDL